MNIITTVAQVIGFAVMAVAGVGLTGGIVYFAANEYFKFAVNRIGGFRVLKNYMIHQLEYYHWLQEKNATKDTPNAHE